MPTTRAAINSTPRLNFKAISLTNDSIMEYYQNYCQWPNAMVTMKTKAVILDKVHMHAALKILVK